MDKRDKHNNTEHGTFSHITDAQNQIMDIRHFPSHVNILKPQIDKIFSEVQKNLPTVDFDSSDISSDGDEPIFFHQNLKLSELSSIFDDDKDLDTSLSQGDDLQLSGSSLENLVSNLTQTNVENKNISAKDETGNTDTELYDNDLAAFLSKSTSPTDDEILKWQLLSKKMDDFEADIEIREEADLKRSLRLGHISQTSSAADATVPCKSLYNTNKLESRKNKDSEQVNIRNESSNYDNKDSDDVDIDHIKLEVESDINSGRDSVPETVKKFHQRLQDGMRLMNSDEQQRSIIKQTMNKDKDKEIISKFTLQEPTTLSLRLFEELDLDSVLNAANEESLPINSLRVLGPRPSSQIIKFHNGGGDKKTDTDVPEELTLIQKLAQLSVLQSGTDIKSISSLDPQTGAVRMGDRASFANSFNAETACQTPGVATSCTGTSTDSGITRATIRYGRRKHEKRDSEPPTVFIDLRGFERQKEEERQGLKNVQRVLRIEACQSKEESSSDDDYEMVERCDWRLTRQKIKQNLSSHGASSTFLHHNEKQADEEPETKPRYKKPPRVIALQEHASSKHWTTSSITKSSIVECESTKNEEEDNKTRMEKLEMEREKERQMKEAMRLREERKKEQEQRLRVGEHIAEGKSAGTTQGRQSAGENTPVVFDIEVSYEPALTTLPSVLPSETLLLTVHLSSNGEIVQHRNRSNRSVDTEEGLSATYIALLSWLLSLVPQEPTCQGSTASTSNETMIPEPTFHVVGLQQLWLEEELRLFVVVAPAEPFYSEMGRHNCSKKGKQKDEIKGSSKFTQHITKFLSVNTLYTVCPWLSTLVPVEVRSDWPEDKEAPPFSYSPPLPKISTKPLSTFIQVNSDPQAARKIFSIHVGFLWQTLDNDEVSCNIDSHDDDGINYETQNTLSLVYKKIFHNPVSLMAILSRATQEGLDLAGIRLLYPCPELLKTQTSEISSSSDHDILNNVGPVLALALRGTFARTIWLDSVGPSDPQLARRTDPNSLCALFGGESRDNVLLFCPRNLLRIQSELTRWFGGRISKGTSTVDVGLPYLKKEEGRGKRWKKTNTLIGPKNDPLPTQRPPAALTATCKSDIFLVLSTIVPTSYFGVIIATGERRGYQIRGIKRLLLTSKLAGSLGICKNMQPYFCPGVTLDELCKDRLTESVAPCTIFLLRKENGAHHMQSLIEACMVQLTLAGLLGCVQMRVNESITSKHLFNVSLYTDGLLALLGGNLSKVPEFDHSLHRSSSINESACKELEQIAVLIMLGHDLLKKCGVYVAKILNVLPYSKTPVHAEMSERFELLGLKWVPALSIHQAKELTPYEVGEKLWRQSVHLLMSEPALVMVLRGVSIFNILKPVVNQLQQHLGATSAKSGTVREGSSMISKELRIECLMSHNPSQSDDFTRLFFHQSELYPDPLARNLLPYLPEFRLYFDILEQGEEGHKIRKFLLKPIEELDLTQENIMQEMVAGQQPITTLMLIKPRAVQRYLQRILKKVVQEQFGIVGLRLLMLPSEIVDAFISLSHKKDNTNYQKHIEALTWGPTLAVALQQQNAVKRLCDLIGPEDPVSASRQSQFLWRGEFGSDVYNNGLYCSANYIDAIRDVKMMFPHGLCCQNSELLAMEEIYAPAEDNIINVNASVNCHVTLTREPHHDSQTHQVTVEDVHHLLLQTICVVLTPPLMKMNSRSRDVPWVDLLAMFLNNEFEVVGVRLVWLTQKQAECLLCVLGGGSLEQVAFICSAPCLVLAMQRDNAVVAFDSILAQRVESLRLMKEFGHLIIQPSSLNQAHSLLSFFFDGLVPGSHVTITKVSQDSGDGASSI